MPQVALTPLGLPSLATNHTKHLRIKVSDAFPSGILNHSLDPQHKDKQIIRYSTSKSVAHINIREMKHIAAVNR